jgi:LacI family transcriptional regulator
MPVGISKNGVNSAAGFKMARQRKQGVTIVDIARELKLSAMTVSRALNGNGEVSERTRQKVLRCANALGYRPNRWARSLVTQKSSIIGIVIPEIAHSFYAEITSGIEDALEQSGYDILLCHSRSDPQRERAEIDALVGSQAEGLIIASVQPEKSPEPLMQLREMGIPFVLIDRFFPKLEAAAVRVDDRAVGRLATECLIDLGHHNIAFIAGPPLSPASLRKRGYLDALRKHGLSVNPQWIVPGNFDVDSGRAGMKRLLETQPRRPTAVFAANDPMGIGAIYACRDSGLEVPRDISIVGAGNIEGQHHPNPFLTTIDWPRHELGRTAANLLLDAIRNPEAATSQGKVLEPSLLRRQSTSRLKGPS